MSKIRQAVPEIEGELAGNAAGDLTAWVVFTQLRPGSQFIYAGWLDATDAEMATDYAREHYGQDQPCVAMWVIERSNLVGTDLREPDDRGGETRPWIVLTQDEPGGLYVSPKDEAHRTVDAATSAEAIAAARSIVPKADTLHGIWVVPQSCVLASEPGDLIWRHSDQGYRLARGYSKGVREKWEKIREQTAINEYEKEDLKEMFRDQ